MIDEELELLANDEVAGDFYLARLRASHIAAEVVPGQYVNIEVSATQAPFLRMPLSVCAVDRGADTIDLLYENMGPKSSSFSRLRPGIETRCLGPLGKGFSAPITSARAVLVGGGIGVPPMIFWGGTLPSTTKRLQLDAPPTLTAASLEASRGCPRGKISRGRGREHRVSR